MSYQHFPIEPHPVLADCIAGTATRADPVKRHAIEPMKPNPKGSHCAVNGRWSPSGQGMMCKLCKQSICRDCVKALNEAGKVDVAASTGLPLSSGEHEGREEGGEEGGNAEEGQGA